MTTPRPAKPRKLAAVLLILFIPFLLTGCLKFTLDLEVSSQDTVSGTAVIGAAKELRALFQGADGGDETTDAFSKLDGVKVSDYDDGTFVGEQYEFSGLPIEGLSFIDEPSSLTIKRDGDNLVVSGNLSLEDEGEEPSEDGVIDLGDGFFDTADVRVSIKFPGEILETNGQLDEKTNTVTWRPKFGEANELNAVVYAPQGIPLWVWWLVAGVALILLITTAVVILRIRTAATPAAGNGEPGPVEGSNTRVDNEPVVRGGTISERADRPVFSYRVRSGPFAKESLWLRVFDEEIDFRFIDRTGNPTTKPTNIPLETIESVSLLEGQAGLGVRIVHSGRIDLLPARTNDAKTLVALVKSMQKDESMATGFSSGSSSITEKRENENTTQQATNSGRSAASRGSAAEDIRELYDLVKEGALTEAEFKELKKRRIEQE